MAVDEAGSLGISASFGVSERIVAARLGVSVDTVRRDRRDGRLGGIPFMKLGEGRRGLIRYDLAELEKFVEARKRAGRVPPQAAAPQPPPVAQAASIREQRDEGLAQPAVQPEPCVDKPVPEPPEPPRRPSPWDVFIPRADADDDPPDDPFAAAGRSAPRRQGSGYWGH
jgi:hypothetical protein